MIAPDQSGDAWRVGTQGNVAGGANGGWYDINCFGYVGGWTMSWIYFGSVIE